MMQKKLNKKKVSIVFILFLLFILPTIGTFSKFVLLKTGTFSFSLKGIPFSSTNLVSQSSTVNYTESTNVLINPERGFYDQLTYTFPATYSNSEKEALLASTQTVNDSLNANNRTLMRTVFYLKNNKSSILSSSWIDALNDYCDVIRNNGNKTLIRFAYDDVNNADPANISIVIDQIDALENFFDTNKDVIFGVELGFLGTWGEWHDSDLITDANKEAVIDEILEVVPSPIQILVRKPAFYKEYFGNGYFDTKLGFTSDNKARIGIYNDGYLSTITDYGTYDTENRTEELKWMKYLTDYTIFGGETIYTENGYFSNDAAIENMTKTHTTFLNSGYHPNVISLWQSSSVTNAQNSVFVGKTFYQYLESKLGYRFVVTDSKLPSSLAQGGYLHVSFDINNTGFNSLIYNRPVNIILEKGRSYYTVTTTIDPRKWESGKTYSNELAFKIPQSIETGDWNVYVQLPDANSSLRNNDRYFIKFANVDNIYDPVLHANYIGKFSITTGTGSSDEGFYQVNVLDVSSNTATLSTADRYTVIDGKKTTDSEWLSTDSIYDTDNNEIYIRNDNNYLYLYTEPGSSINLASIHVLFSTIDSPVSTSYNYGIENGTLYPYSSTFDTSNPTSIEYDKDIGFEYKIPLNALNISSIDDLRSVYVEYIDSSWASQLTIGPVVLIEDTIRIADGQITFSNEYTSDDIFEQTSDYTIYVRLVDGYYWVYAVHNSIDLSATPNVRLYMGTRDKTLFKDNNGYMAFMDGGTVHACTNSDCSTNSSIAYSGARGINTGVEFKFPADAVNGSSLRDILKLKILYMSSGWSQVGSVSVTKTEKIYPDEVVGKTLIFATKPADWTGVRVHVYPKSGTAVTTWPGETMHLYADEDEDKVAYVLPDDSEYYVVFNNLASSSTQYPMDKQNIFRIEGKSRIWSGSTTDGLYSWTYFDSSDAPTYTNNTTFEMDGSLSNACVYLWDDVTTSGTNSIYAAWSGTPLSKVSGTWTKTINLEDKYGKYKILFTNCSGTKYHQNNSAILRRGITVYGTSDSIWVTED